MDVLSGCRQSARLIATWRSDRTHSDKGKFCNALNKPKGCELPERALSRRSKFEDFPEAYGIDVPALVSDIASTIGSPASESLC